MHGRNVKHCNASLFERLLRNYVPFKEIGWAHIGEEFTRFQLLKSRWLNIYLHKLNAPNWHPDCHDHPWGFVAILLKGGYLERVACPFQGGHEPDEECGFIRDMPRRPGSILWRPATFIHNVITPYGTSWSIIFAGPKSREWGFKPCDRPAAPTVQWYKYRSENK